MAYYTFKSYFVQYRDMLFCFSPVQRWQSCYCVGHSYWERLNCIKCLLKAGADANISDEVSFIFLFSLL